MAASDSMVEMKVLTEKVDKALFEFAEACGKTVQEMIPQEAKNFTRDVVKLTPPLVSLSGRESWGAQKKIGERAVEKEILGAFRPVSELGLFADPEKPALGRIAKRLQREGDGIALASLLRNAGYDEVHVGRVIDVPTEDLHDDLRDSRGKVRRGAQKGRFWIMNVPGLKRFIKEQQAQVGRLKRGWGAAADKLGVSLPQWIRRHRVDGSFVDHSRARMNPHVKITNSVSYAGDQNVEVRFVAIALKNRIGKWKRQLEAKAKGKWGK